MPASNHPPPAPSPGRGAAPSAPAAWRRRSPRRKTPRTASAGGGRRSSRRGAARRTRRAPPPRARAHFHACTTVAGGGRSRRRPRCRFLRLAGVARAGEHGAAPSRPAHHATRSAALSLVFPRRQPRGIYVDRAKARQPRHLRAADRRRLSFAADDRPAQRLQPGLVARRPLDRLPAPSIGSRQE